MTHGITRILFAGLALVLLAAPSAHGAGSRDKAVMKGELGQKLDAVVRKAGGAELWGTVLVAREGKVVLSKGYGFADYENDPITPRTLFELASVSKQVTAVAILHLEQRGRLKLADTLDRFFGKIPADKKAITVHHLLTHTSGLSDASGVAYRSSIPRRAFLRRVMEMPLKAEPGTRYEYGNVGYALLAAIVELVSKSSFENYVEKHLFRPAKMTDSGFIGDADLKKTGRVSSRRTSEPGHWTAANWHRGWGYRGMGGVVTTTLDMLRWDRALRGDDILGDEAKRKMYTPARSNYGCGWHIDVTDRGTRKAHHMGSVAGYGTNLVRYLEDDVLIVILSNHGRPAYEIARAIESELFTPAAIELSVNRKGYKADARGLVRLPASLAWDARKKGKMLTLRLKGGGRIPVEIRASAGWGAKLLATLDAILSAQDGGENDPVFVETLLCLGPYGSAGRLNLQENLKLLIEADRRGKPKSPADRRWHLHIQDGSRRFSPVFTRLNLAGIQLLADALRSALE